MGFLQNRLRYPIKYWIKQSTIFSLCMISILFIDSFYREQGSLWLSIGIAFLALFTVILLSLILHVHFDVKDPIKSPFKVKILGYLIALFVCLITITLSANLGTLTPEEYRIIQGSRIYFFLLSGFRAVILDFIVLLWLYFLMNDYFKNQLELERSKLDKLKERAINQMLRQQVQPHFLFNALSSLKSLIKKDSMMAESYLLQLSDYLRGSFMTSDDGLATVKQELKLCEDYLSMQKIRFNEAIQYKISVSSDVLDAHLPIFSLQPLVDNALKHNHYTIENPLFIDIEQGDGWIIVRNNICPRKYATLDRNNYGLNNLKERFSYYLKDSVIIREEGPCFEVHVKIIHS